ncbi:MAG TPA: hypothetical protein VMT73_09870 [Anaerolineales bacterium]|nr:hypothetical protein [Anaerolineales bacterium]
MKSEGFKTFTAIMIAIVSVVGALVTWRAALASNEASQDDFTGLAAAINAQESQVLTAITVSEHYQAFLDYTRYNELGNQINDEIQKNNSTDGSLTRQKSDAWGIAFGLQSLFFPQRYLLPNGTYDVQRETDEQNAEAERTQDVKPELHFTQADTLRLKANLQVVILILLGISFWFFTLAQINERGIKYFFAAGGLLTLIVSVLASVFVELVM